VCTSLCSLCALRRELTFAQLKASSTDNTAVLATQTLNQPPIVSLKVVESIYMQRAACCLASEPHLYHRESVGYCLKHLLHEFQSSGHESKEFIGGTVAILIANVVLGLLDH